MINMNSIQGRSLFKSRKYIGLLFFLMRPNVVESTCMVYDCLTDKLF